VAETTTPAASVAEVVRRAGELEADGDWSRAIDLLADANRADRADELEMALANLRMRAFAPMLAAGVPLLDPPPATAEPPVGPSGLPETTTGALTGGSLRSAIAGHGALVVRNALTAEQAAWWASAIDRSLDAREATREADPTTRSSWWQPLAVGPELENGLARKWIRVGGGTLLADSPRLLAALLDLYTDLGLRTVIGEYLGGRPILSANKCTLRRVALDATGGWHQDGAFLGQHVRALNVWVALTPCGVDAPGLALVPRRFDEIVETGTGGSYFDWAVGPEVVTEVAGDAGVVRPVFAAGDMVLFDEYFLHCTYVEPSMTAPRHAIESWCFAPTAYPEGHVPLVW
jgi:hypothetical protein